MLLGSAFANMGTCASVVISHAVATLDESTVGEMAGGTGTGFGFMPYWLNVVARFKFAEIQVLATLFPCK